jgi:hypothetical protein
MSLREELIQVAAVAVAIVTDMNQGTTELDQNPDNLEMGWHHRQVMQAVQDERIRQEAKWGAQHHTIPEWMMILGEEYGEACQAGCDSYNWAWETDKCWCSTENPHTVDFSHDDGIAHHFMGVTETNLVCDQCGGRKAQIRGRDPESPDREVCPTCLVETIETMVVYQPQENSNI